MTTPLYSRRFLYLAGILLLVFLTMGIYSHVLGGEDYTTYKTHIVFEDYVVPINGTPYRLDGVINGLLFADYNYRSDHVVVETYYESYDIEGFTDNIARQYIKGLLDARNTRIYDRYEPPYPASESFVLKGGLKYYVSPYYSGLFPVYRQYTGFLIVDNGTRTVIREYRFFRYAIDGRLVQSVINAIVDSGGTVQRYYFELIPVDSNDASILLFTEENIIYMDLIGMISSIIALIYYWLKNR